MFCIFLIVYLISFIIKEEKRILKKLIFFILSFFIWIFPSSKILNAQSILIEGGVENIVLLADAGYLDKTPIVFFSAQLQDRWKDIIDKVDIVVLTGNDHEFSKKVEIYASLSQKPKLVYMFESKEAEGINKRLNLEEFEHLNVRSQSKLNSDTYKDGHKTVIDFKRINSTRYLIWAKASESFWLVFSESYHEKWKAYIRIKPKYGKEELTETQEPWSALVNAWRDKKNKLELNGHYIVNGYANSWWVPIENVPLPPESKEKRLEIILEYQPQRLFEIGLFISILTLFSCIAYFLFHGIKRIRLKIGKSP